VEEWVDEEVETLTALELVLLEESIRPVKMVLAKVGHKDAPLTRY
jgi:hypothetical protein